MSGPTHTTQFVDFGEARGREASELHELLPCPFCGGTPVLVTHAPHSHSLATFLPDHPGSATIECTCDVGMIDETAEKVAAKWNCRAG